MDANDLINTVNARKSNALLKEENELFWALISKILIVCLFITFSRKASCITHYKARTNHNGNPRFHFVFSYFHKHSNWNIWKTY